MLRFRVLAVLLAALAPAALFAAPVPVGGKPADVSELPVAANAMVVVQVNGLERVKERIVKMVGSVDADAGKQAGEQIDGFLKGALEGRDLAGLDPQGRVFLAVGNLGEVASADGPIAVLLPVKDYKTFREKFLSEGERKSFQKGKGGVDEIEFEPSGGSALYLVDTTTGYVVASPNRDTAEAYAGKYEKLTAKKMGNLADAFLANDLGIFLNLARVNEEYAGQIAQARAAVGQLFQLFGGDVLDKSQIEQAKRVVEGLFQVIEDGTGLVLAIDARPEGFALRAEAGFNAGSTTDQLLAAETPSPLKGLADLPKGMSSYSASQWGQGLGGLQRKLSAEFASDDDKAADAINKLVDLGGGAGESVSMSGADFASLTATTYKDAAKVSAAKLAVFQALDEGAKYSNLVLKRKPKVTADAQSHAGFKLHAAEIEVDFEASVQKAGDPNQKEAAIEAMKKLMPEKQTLWFGTDGKRYVQVTGKNWDTAKKLLDEFATPKAKVGDDPAFAVTRKQLPADAGYLLLTDAVPLLGQLSDYAGQLGGAIPGAPAGELPKFGKGKGDTAYIGMAVAARKQSVRFDLFVPVGAVKAAMKAAEEGEKDKDK